MSDWSNAENLAVQEWDGVTRPVPEFTGFKTIHGLRTVDYRSEFPAVGEIWVNFRIEGRYAEIIDITETHVKYDILLPEHQRSGRMLKHAEFLNIYKKAR